MQKYWLSGPISNRVSKHWLGSLADKLRAVGPKRGKLLWNMSEVVELDSYLRTNKTVMNLTRPNKHDPIISQIPVPSLTVSVERLAAIAFFFTILLSATVAYGVSSDQIYGADSDDEDLVILEVVSLPPSKKLTELQTQKKLDPGAVHCVTLFSDLTESEFRTNFVGVNRLRLSADSQKAPILPTGDLASDFDWRDHGDVTLVREQDSCGLRWSLSE
ncbi:Cysteine protease RD19A, partial [Cucurbita argyrosperma subsp. sororia]